jgi:hypothetical protein
VLAVHGPGRAGSPVNNAFLLLDTSCGPRRNCAAPIAVVTDEDGETALAEPWSTAESALIEAAMAFGAPNLVTDAGTLTASPSATARAASSAELHRDHGS